MMQQSQSEADSVMQAHAAHFAKQIYKIDDDIHLAVGFAASNVAMIEADEGLIIVDTTESTAAATNILAEFRKISDKPIIAIIYTHSHRDHISGASVFAANGTPDIYASPEFNSDLIEEANGGGMPKASLMARTKAQFGIGLPEDERLHLGLGPGDRPLGGLGAGFLSPTKTLAAGETQLTIGGFTMTVFPAPGETPDHYNIWLEDRNILFCGDNFYHAFPNLYAVRGTPYRDFQSWADTLTKLAARRAEILVPGHSQPVFGQAEIEHRLTTTSAAIQAAIQTAFDGMNAGLDFETIAARAVMPTELADLPWLVEHYGSFAYAVRACCVGLMGWYSGVVDELVIRDPVYRARDWVALIGGIQAIPEHIATAELAGKYDLVLELTAMALAVMGDAEGDAHDTVLAARRRALRHIAAHMINAPVRNSLFTAAQAIQTDGGNEK